MTVYVDDMYRYPIGQFGRMKMSHMVADTDEELHAMADTIGVARRWFQGDHYDVSMSMRLAAIANGAIAIEYRTCGLMCSNRDAGWPFTPDNAKEIFKLRYALREYMR